MSEEEMDQELSTDELKDVVGGLNGAGNTTPWLGEQTQNIMGQTKAMKKLENHPKYCGQSSDQLP
tara:strand:+ start:306 stop:500 length:195 start_codon:yes stop_codon:yes gene_type:complete